MKTSITYIFTLTITLFLFSCEKSVTIKINDFDKTPKLVVVCYISPQDTVVSASITTSVPLYGKVVNFPPSNITTSITTALVTLSDDVRTQQLVYNSVTRTYTISGKFFPIIAGTTYTLNVEAANFKSVTASTTVPLTNNTTLQVDTLRVADPNNIPRTKVVVRARWQDKAGELNYYQVVFVAKRFDQSKKDTVSVQVTSSPFNDINKDGALFEKTETIPFKTPGSPNPYLYTECEVYLFNTSKPYYDLHKSLEDYSPDNPFTEASPLYSNIVNGLGIFAGCNGYKVQLK